MDGIICCLGNPGKEYEKTRHNIGFKVGDALVDRFSLDKSKTQFKSHVYTGFIDDKKVVVIYPQTYMNLSGEAVKAAMKWFSLPPEKLLVIYDDVDIVFGKCRFRQKGSGGTHNGMKSIIGKLMSSDFPRLRIGVGPIPERWDLADYVLSKFTDQEMDELPPIITRCESVVSTWLNEGVDAATRLASK